MDHESEGGQQGIQQQWLELDSTARDEANLGFQQMRFIEQQLRAAPQGILGRVDEAEAQALRTNIINASVIIVSCFNTIIGRLSAAPLNNSTSSRNDNISAADQITGRVKSLMSTSHTTYDSSPPHSPRHNTSVPAAAANSKRPITSPVLSPSHTPRSGSGLSEDSHSPLSPRHLDGDGDVAAGVVAGQARRPANEAATSADPEIVKQRNLSLKRKFMPKVTVKQRATGTYPGNDGPPDDGYTWRKYGQKDILGSMNARSYYRCSHKIELGCPALKLVQRCDDDPSTFDVTYRGKHTCRSMGQQQLSLPFYTPEQSAMVGAHHQLPSSDSTRSPAMVNFPSIRGTVVNSSAAQQNHVMANSGEILLGGNRPVFPQISAITRGNIPSTTRFGLASSSIEVAREVGMPQQGFSVKSEDSMHSQQATSDLSRVPQHGFSVKSEDSQQSQQATYDLSRLTKVSSDGLFGPGSNLYNILLASTRPEQNVIPSKLVEEGLEAHGDLKRVKRKQLLVEPTRSTSSDHSGLVVKSSDVVQNAETWPADLVADGFLSLGLDDRPVPARFNTDSSTVRNIGQSSRELPNNPPPSVERRQIDSMRELDTSQRRSAQFNMGLDIIDYDPIIFNADNTFYSS